MRRAMHLKQERCAFARLARFISSCPTALCARSEISEQLRMIESRLRLHADVLFADEQDSLNEQK